MKALGGVCLLSLLIPMRCVAQEGAGQGQDAPSHNLAEPTSLILPAESVGPDDLLELMVPYCVELTRSFRVSSDGSLSLPLLDHPIQVAGMTPLQIADKVKTALEDAKVMTQPVVNVSVLEYRSRPVSVVGSVNHPLTFQATGQTTLLDAIAKAGGLAQDAGASILITSRSLSLNGETHRSVRTLSTASVLSNSTAAEEIRIEGGEEIRIPQAGKIFVAGNVRRPGMYVMQGSEDTTVVKALALSEGLEPYSGHIAYIYRRNASGSREEVKVPLHLIMQRKQPDVALMADDILYIPTNDGKRMTDKVLAGLAGFGATTAAGVLIYK